LISVPTGRFLEGRPMSHLGQQIFFARKGSGSNMVFVCAKAKRQQHGFRLCESEATATGSHLCESEATAGCWSRRRYHRT